MIGYRWVSNWLGGLVANVGSIKPLNTPSGDLPVDCPDTLYNQLKWSRTEINRLTFLLYS